MDMSHKKHINFQVLISYFGISPFIIILLDIHLFNMFLISLLKEFIFFYTLLIFTFIGAMRWDLNGKSNNYEILLGFIPSLLSTFLIFIYLLGFNRDIIFLFLFAFISLQLLVDFIFSKYNYYETPFFFKVRLPVTLIILLNLFYLISV